MFTFVEGCWKIFGKFASKNICWWLNSGISVSGNITYIVFGFVNLCKYFSFVLTLFFDLFISLLDLFLFKFNFLDMTCAFQIF